MQQPHHHLVVLGAGVMGASIATLAVGHGVPVTLIDVNDAKLAAAEPRIAGEPRLARLMGALPEHAPEALSRST
ncbi:3-hydroxyacyl-CoA dehydrogenase NAD-binding domain-containing protein [Streptomyces malaysiensis]|uniref:NAD-binding protein 3-hydroxyacyl-CoA dehydrogenase n=1 Tax=Streptomyces malaysiensis TaxID=92644 RepID=A0A7X5WZT2_STRMQ|nr:3-hydroxyacyl-CoA dehydrogenase NAD-binding domain-containing protein [Streptomyces malaysiensis]NIY64049.1 NAD-binding protein 3-hydroxyacyl-CoA dehydrogenase [Streptomyces malaysiensis]